MTRFRAAAVAAMVLAGAPAHAVPTFLPVQGYLTNAAGAPLQGAVAATFRLYPGSGGTGSVWTEGVTLAVEAGAFVAYLGMGSPLDLAIFRDYPDLYLGVTLAPDPEMDLVPLGTTAYAAMAQACGDAQTLAGLAPADLTYSAGEGVIIGADQTLSVDKATVQAWAKDEGAVQTLAVAPIEFVRTPTYADAAGEQNADASWVVVKTRGWVEYGADSSAVHLVAPLRVPDGATVVDLECMARDSSADKAVDIEVALWRSVVLEDQPAADLFLAASATLKTTASFADGATQLSSSGDLAVQVDHATRVYSLVLTWRGDGGGLYSLYFQGCRVSYVFQP